MTEREKIEILQKKAEIPEVVRKKMHLAYGSDPPGETDA